MMAVARWDRAGEGVKQQVEPRFRCRSTSSSSQPASIGRRWRSGSGFTYSTRIDREPYRSCRTRTSHAVTSRNNRMIWSSARFNSASISSSGRGGVYR